MESRREKGRLPKASRLIYGCMGLGGGWNANPVSTDDVLHANAAVDAALECGLNVFDHADIYAFGKAEEVFGLVLKERPELRDQMMIQSKCGIRFADDLGPKRYDFSRQWVVSQVEAILQRLSIEQLDILLLHRPDPLMKVGELCQTLELLHEQGKVVHFGVSNMHWYQIDYLEKNFSLPIVANQLELSLAKHDWIEEGLFAGHAGGQHVHSSGGTLEYCEQNGIQLQAWGSLAQGLYTGQALEGQTEAVRRTAKIVRSMAEKYQVSGEAIVVAWLMRHPAEIQPVIGTSTPERIRACAQACDVTLSREDWYALYVAARGAELP